MSKRVKLWAYHGDGDSLRAEVRERLAAGSPNRGPSEVTDATLLDYVVWSLNWDYGAAINSIACDMWNGISTATYDGKLSIYVQCDSVLDGIAATWKAIAERVEARER